MSSIAPERNARNRPRPRRLGLLVAGAAVVMGAFAGAAPAGAAPHHAPGAAKDRDCIVSASAVEKAFGGTAELLNAPTKGLCTVAVEDARAGGDGTIEIVFLHGRGGSPDEAGEFDAVCLTNNADALPGIGDDACYTSDFNTATVLVDDQIIEIRAYSFYEGSERGIQRSVVKLAKAVARNADST
jgi:hypothetical protein